MCLETAFSHNFHCVSVCREGNHAFGHPLCERIGDVVRDLESAVRMDLDRSQGITMQMLKSLFDRFAVV